MNMNYIILVERWKILPIGCVIDFDIKFIAKQLIQLGVRANTSIEANPESIGWYY